MSLTKAKGGARPGAGRPACTLRSKATCTQANISLSPSEADEANEARGDTPLTTFVRMGFLTYLRSVSR